MFLLTILSDYIFWHYTTALVNYLRIYKNFWCFIVQYFSLPQLLDSLLAPYKKIKEERGSLFNLEALFSFLIINLLSRLIGFVVRLCIILLGIFCLVIFNITALLSYAVWLVAPIIIIYCLFYGLYLIVI